MLLLLLLVLPFAAVVPLAPALDIIIYGMSRTGLPAASWLWLCLWLWLWVWLARPPVWLQRETDSIMVMVMVIVSTCAAGVMPRRLQCLSCFVLSCLVLSRPADARARRTADKQLLHAAARQGHTMYCAVYLYCLHGLV
jgi:hypothetical protein